MLTVISPAKSLDMDPVSIAPTQPEWQADAVRLAKTMRGQTLTQLKGLMSISDDLAKLNRDRFKAFAAEPLAETTKPAALAFNGDTYQGRRPRLRARSPEDFVRSLWIVAPFGCDPTISLGNGKPFENQARKVTL